VIILDDNDKDDNDENISCSFGDEGKCKHKSFMPPSRDWKKKGQEKKISKRCNRCCKILPLTEFGKYGGERGKKGGLQSYRSYCKSCRADLKLIREHRNKYRLNTEFFNGKCHDCGVDIRFTLLISSEFHHPNRKLKSATWDDMSGKKYEKIKEWAIKDKVIPLCADCHLLRQATTLILFEKVILQKGLFNKTPEEIDKLLDLAINQNKKTKNLNFEKKAQKKYNIKFWIRKRFAIKQFSQVYCIGCKKVIIFQNLAAFIIHHLNILEMENKWTDLRHLDCEIILRQLIDEECVWICSNCHSIIHSNFHKLVEEVYKDYFSEKELKKISFDLTNTFETITRRINNFQLNIAKIDFSSPLKLEFGQEDIWKIHLLKIYHFTQKLGSELFTINQLIDNLGSSQRTHNQNVKNLIEKGFIKIDFEIGNQIQYKLTQEGITESKRLEHEHKTKSEEIRNTIIIKDIQLENNSKKHTGSVDIVHIYCTAIYEIIQTKGFNEFIIKDLKRLLNRTKGMILDNIKRTLIPLEYIEEIEFPLYTDYSRHPSVFKLTEKGIEIAKLNPKFKNSVDRFREVDSSKIVNKNLILLKNIYNSYGNNDIIIKNLINDNIASLISNSLKYENIRSQMNVRIKELLAKKLIEKTGNKGKWIVYRITKKGTDSIKNYFNT